MGFAGGGLLNACLRLKTSDLSIFIFAGGLLSHLGRKESAGASFTRRLSRRSSANPERRVFCEKAVDRAGGPLLPRRFFDRSHNLAAVLPGHPSLRRDPEREARPHALPEYQHLDFRQHQEGPPTLLVPNPSLPHAGAPSTRREKALSSSDSCAGETKRARESPATRTCRKAK